jgi:hypothetical protein
MAPAQGKGLPMKKLITVALAACFLAMEGRPVSGVWEAVEPLSKSRQPVWHTTYMGEEVTDDIRIVNEMRKDRELVVGVPGISSAIFKQ